MNHLLSILVARQNKFCRIALFIRTFNTSPLRLWLKSMLLSWKVRFVDSISKSEWTFQPILWMKTLTYDFKWTQVEWIRWSMIKIQFENALKVALPKYSVRSSFYHNSNCSRFMLLLSIKLRGQMNIERSLASVHSFLELQRACD